MFTNKTMDFILSKPSIGLRYGFHFEIHYSKEGIKMKKLLEIMEKGVTLQLKAYYIGNLGENTTKLADKADVDPYWMSYIQFPEWVLPACSIVAALIALGTLTKSIIGFIRNKK